MIEQLEKAIEQLRSSGRNTYYGFSMNITPTVAEQVRQYFSSKGRVVEIRRCPKGLYDIIITWPLDQ